LGVVDHARALAVRDTMAIALADREWSLCNLSVLICLEGNMAYEAL